VLVEKSAACPENRDEKNKKVEFTTPAFNVLNALEQMGYKVATSAEFVAGHKKFDLGGTKDHLTAKKNEFIQNKVIPYLCF
jgi:hypothetical protein